MDPCCDAPRVAQWLIGWFPHRGKNGGHHSHDPNQRHCHNCGKKWFVPCPSKGCKWHEERMRQLESVKEEAV